MIKKKIYALIILMVVLLIGGLKVNSYAETKSADIISLDEDQDIVISFTFDDEVVDITLISPSGERLTKDSTDKVEYDEGKKWSVFYISSAKKGTWKAEYDLKRNKEITFSVATSNDEGLYIDTFEYSLSSNRLIVTFEASGSSMEEYDYELYATDVNDQSKVSTLAKGTAPINEVFDESIDLKNLAAGTYSLRLDVNAKRGAGEIFDSLNADDTFTWDGRKSTDVLEGFLTIIDEGNNEVFVDWRGFKTGNFDTEKLTITADDTLAFDSELDGSSGMTSCIYPVGTKVLKISLAAKKDGMWSDSIEKEITLGEEYLRLLSSDVSGDKKLELGYKANKESELYVSINGTKGTYTINGESSLFFDVEEDITDIEASFDADNDIQYVVNKSVFHDAYPPEIKLYDDLDGKTFYTESVDILGSIKGGNTLKINGEEILLEGNSFSYNMPLSLGENLVEIEAIDEGNNSSKMLLTIYRDTEILGGINKNKGLMNFLPLFISLAASLLLIIYSLIFMKKKVKGEGKKKHKIWKWVLWDILVILGDVACIWQLIARYVFSNSLDFLELAEKSVADATNYMKLMYVFGIGAIALLVIAIISAVITGLLIKKNHRLSEEEE